MTQSPNDDLMLEVEAIATMPPHNTLVSTAA